MTALLLADEMFLIGHDEYSGKAHISENALDTVIAGAVLGELTIGGRIGVSADTHVVAYSDAPQGDPVTDYALAEIIKQPQRYPVRAWVEHLRQEIRPRVAARLETVGMIERVETRVMLKTTVRYPARDPIKAAAPQAKVRFMLDRPDQLDEQTAVLVGLILASNLEFVFGGATPREVRAGLTRLTERLRPELTLLIRGVESAIAALVLSARR